MEIIIKEVAILVSSVLDKLRNSQIFNPIYFAILDDENKITEEIKDISLENSIDKVLDKLNFNEIDAAKAAVIFPAELEDDNKKRYSVILVVISDYEESEYLTFALSYKQKNGFMEVSNFEILDYSPLLESDLKHLQEEFLINLYNLTI